MAESKIKQQLVALNDDASGINDLDLKTLEALVSEYEKGEVGLAGSIVGDLYRARDILVTPPSSRLEGIASGNFPE